MSIITYTCTKPNCFYCGEIARVGRLRRDMVADYLGHPNERLADIAARHGISYPTALQHITKYFKLSNGARGHLLKV